MPKSIFIRLNHRDTGLIAAAINPPLDVDALLAKLR